MFTPTEFDHEVLALMKFYQVDSEYKLIKAQSEHIERLQARVAKAEIVCVPFRVNVPRRG